MKINISESFNYPKLLRFTFPSIIMMFFTSIYIIVDGYFVSNYAGKTSLAAVNFAYPVVMVLGSIGFMFGTGGSALVSKKLGEKKEGEANSIFSMLVVVSPLIGLVLTIVGLSLMDSIASLMGAEGELKKETVIYGKILLFTLPFYILQYEFQCFFVTANKPKLGLYFTILSGLTNVVFDYVFIALFKWGIVGGALATSLSQVIGGLFPLIYFIRKNSSLLHLSLNFRLNLIDLINAVSNGSSEFLGNISSSFISTLYNLQLLKYIGEDGIAAYGVIMYINLVFLAFFIGYSVGVAPIVSYNYGAKNKIELKSLIRKSYIIIVIASLTMYGISLLLSMPLSLLFVGYDYNLTIYTKKAFDIFALSFLFCGISIYTSSLFTALNNGFISALLSILRLLFLQGFFIIAIPKIFGGEGIWLANVLAEAVALIISLFFLNVNKKRYGY